MYFRADAAQECAKRISRNVRRYSLRSAIYRRINYHIVAISRVTTIDYGWHMADRGFRELLRDFRKSRS